MKAEVAGMRNFKWKGKWPVSIGFSRGETFVCGRSSTMLKAPSSPKIALQPLGVVQISVLPLFRPSCFGVWVG